MANYWCYQFVPERRGAFAITAEPNPTMFTARFKVAYVGSDVPEIGSDSEKQGPFLIQDRIINVEILLSDTPAQMLTKVTSAIVADALSIGVTVGRTAGLVCSFARGT